jgi:hypothetical protein
MSGRMTRPSLMARMRGMNQRSLFGPGTAPSAAADAVPGERDDGRRATGPRAEAIQRLQIGLFGIGAMVLLVGLASIIGSQVDLADQAAVPDAAPTTEPTAAASQPNPLADAGVVPDIGAEPSPSPAPSPLDLPRPGAAAPGDDAASQ